MFPQLVEALFPNVPAHIVTFENAYCQRARYIDLRQIQNPATELFQFWNTEIPTETQFPFQHGLEMQGNVANELRLKKNHKNAPENPFFTVEVDYLAYQNTYNGQDINWEPAHEEWLKQEQRKAMIAAADASRMPYTAAIDSGNKSIHFIFRLDHTPEYLRKLRDPRSDIHYLYKYLQFLLSIVLGDYDHGVFSQSGYKLSRTPCATRESGALQNIVGIGSSVTIDAFLLWCHRQLSPEALEVIRADGNYSYKLAKKSPYALLTDQYLKDNILGSDFYNDGSPFTIRTCTQGYRGNEWRMVAKKIMLAGSREPRQQMGTPTTNDPSLAPYDASFLWYFSFHVFNALCEVPFYPETADVLRWEVTSQEEIRLDPQTYGHAVGADMGEVQLIQQLKANIIAAPQEDIIKAEKKVLKEEKIRHQEVAAANPNFRSNIAGIGAAMSSFGGGASGGDDFNYGHEAAYVLELLDNSGIKLKYVVSTDDTSRETWWQYQFDPYKHTWVMVSETYVRTLLTQVRPDFIPFSPHKKQSIIKEMRDIALYHGEWHQNRRARIFTNGTGYLVGDIYTTAPDKLFEFYPDHWDVNDNAVKQFDYPYDPTARCIEFENFLAEVVEDPDSLNLLHEFMGSATWMTNTHQSFAVLHGEGGDGKGVFCKIMLSVFGGDVIHPERPESYSSKITLGDAQTFYLHKMTEKHAASMMMGARLLIDEEIRVTSDRKENEAITADLKRLVGDGEVMREDKSKQISKERADALIMLCCNQEPRFKDLTDAMWRRLKIIRFGGLPEGKKIIEQYQKHFMTPERMSGIFNWCLLGMQKLAMNIQDPKKQTLTMTSLSQNLVNELRGDSDFLLEFMETNFVRHEVVFPNEKNNKKVMYGGHPPIALDAIWELLDRFLIARRININVSPTMLRKYIRGKKDITRGDRLHEFSSMQAALNSETLGVKPEGNSRRVYALLGYQCVHPDFQEILGNIHHAGMNKQNENLKGNFNQGAAGGS